MDGDLEDPIAASSLDVRDFIVEGFEVVDIIQPERITDKDRRSVAKTIDAKDRAFDGRRCRETHGLACTWNWSSELGSAEKPRIQILGGAGKRPRGQPERPAANHRVRRTGFRQG